MSIMTLWQPILATAVLVFFAGSVIWMAMPWHKSDWSEAPDEGSVRSALKGLAPGQYNVPHCIDQSALKNPEMQQKFREGPIAFITILPSGLPNMGPRMVMMFVYNLSVAILAAYFVSRFSSIDAEYMSNFRIASAVTFIAYGFAYVQESIWFGRPWSSTLNNFLDAAIYAGVTGGVFGWLV